MRAPRRTAATAAVLALLLAVTWSLTADAAGGWRASGAVGVVRAAVAFGVGAALPRWWAPALALAVPVSSIGSGGGEDRTVAIAAATAVMAGFVALGAAARLLAAGADRLLRR